MQKAPEIYFNFTMYRLLAGGSHASGAYQVWQPSGDGNEKR